MAPYALRSNVHIQNAVIPEEDVDTELWIPNPMIIL